MGEQGRQLRQTIVDNFRSQDCLERQNEIDEILQRKSEDEQEHAALQVRRESLQEILLQLQKQLEEIELKRAQEEALQKELERKREHDSRRLAWLDRFNQPSLQSPAVQTSALESCGAQESDSDASTLFEDDGGAADADVDVNSDVEILSVS